jgi:hypothetical protein
MGEAGSPVTVVSLPAEDGPRNEARPQAGLEGDVKKVLTADSVGVTHQRVVPGGGQQTGSSRRS